MAPLRNPLLETLREPGRATTFTLADWSMLLRQARQERLVARLGILLEDAGLIATCPSRITETTRAARSLVEFHQIQIACELRRLAEGLRGLDSQLLLLKGAAYLSAALPFSRGRLMADIDVLVRRDQLSAVEQRLLDQGWQSQTLDRYDQRYYRQWMHEIPPLSHPDRGIEIDVHHSLLPLTARVRPDPELLWNACRPLPEAPFSTLAPIDMVLHRSAHLFYDGEIRGRLSELLDLAQMFGHFGKEPSFWMELPARAEALELTRPLYYAARYCSRILHTAVPPDAQAYIERLGAPPGPVRRLMDLLVEPVLTPQLPGSAGAPVTGWLLYVRSHWLRMPPWLLTRHLSRKAWRRFRGGLSEPN